MHTNTARRQHTAMIWATKLVFVAEGPPATPSGAADSADLLTLAMARPRDALARAREILAGRPGPAEAMIAHQAAGIVLREIDDVDAGIGELRRALRLARRLGLRGHEADVLGSLGVAFVYASRTADGLAAFDRAIELSDGVLLGRVLHRRGHVLWTLGRYAAALADFRRAVAVLRPAGDQVWEARALNGRGLVYLAVGLPARADADFVAAARLLALTGQELASGHAVLNRGVAAFRSGDLPAALSFFDQAGARYRSLDVSARSYVSLDRCDVLLAAGLAAEALAEADAAISDIEEHGGRSTKRAELLLMAASCALAAAQPQAALDRARRAHRLFRSQQSAWGQAHAGLVAVQARYASGQLSGRLLLAAAQAATRLSALGSAEASQAHLLAGRVALALGRRADAELHLTSAAQGRRRGPAISRVAGWLAEALHAEAVSDPRRLQIACRRGLEVLDQHRWTLGASELRAQATAHGAELAALAQRHAARTRQPRLLLTWSERWRATALAVPAVRPPGAGFDAELAAVRQATTRLEDARREGVPAAPFERDLQRLERAVRDRSLRTPGSAAPSHLGVEIADLLGRLDDGQLAEIADVDGTLQVLICGDGRVRLLTAGSTRDAVRAADFARFALRRLARARPGADLESAAAILDVAGPRLQQAILGPAADLLRDGPLVIVPPGRLHAIPWALLPALTRRPFTVAPSARAWFRAKAAVPPVSRRVVLATGPGLVTGGAEVPLAAALYPGATVLSGPDATAGRVLAALDGAWLAHIAAHGTFRADSPMFSALHLHDGPLTVYDFEQLGRAPHWMVLPSCDSGVLAPAGADELLGLVSSLLPLGTAGVVAGVVPVNDQAVIPLMTALHQQLAAGRSLAESLLSVRTGTFDDLVQRAAAMSLLTLGAG